MTFKYKSYFPFKEIRPEQTKAIDFALDAFINKDKKFVILEMGTGGGKSPVAITISKYLAKHMKVEDSYEKGCWLLTTQKILQDQYIKDFGPPKGNCRSVKSASNYKCDFFKKNKCSESLHLLKEADPDSKFYKKCYYTCKYKDQKRFFLSSDQGVTNFPYFLTETSYVGKITPRQLLVVDECHTIEDELSKFIEIVISERFSSAILKTDMPEIRSQKEAYKWVKETYMPALTAKVAEVEAYLLEVQKEEGEDSEKTRKTSSHKEKLSKHVSKIQQFISVYTKENWVFNLIPSWNGSGKKLEFKSIDVGEYAHEHLFKFGNKVLLLSATVLNKEAFCESIGVSPEDAAFISIDSPFPKENTPTFFIPAGDMGRGKIDQTLPNMAEIIKALIDEHKNEKGIIHTRTFKIANYLKDNIKTSRFLTHDSENREEILKKHMTSKKPTILLSPSSTEGLDLKDELSRFQIICKLHWPYLGDELIKRRMDKYNYWYPYQAVKSLIQAKGRSIRTADDYAVTYILDDAFERLFSQNISLFPSYFKESLHMD